MTVEIRRGSARFVTRDAGRETRHAFSFGPHYDAERLGFGPLVCHDEHLLRGGVGFDPHRHSGLVILTYVVDGAVRHGRADLDGTLDLPTGSLGVLVTGAGVEHSEHAVGTPTRFVQFWLTDPDADDRAVEHTVHDATRGLAPLDLPVPGASVTVLRVAAGESATLPAAPRLYVTVARGALLRFSLAEPLQAGDSICLDGEGDYTVTAGVDTDLVLLTLP